jgi:hypothetical protein
MALIKNFKFLTQESWGKNPVLKIKSAFIKNYGGHSKEDSDKSE